MSLWQAGESHAIIEGSGDATGAQRDAEDSNDCYFGQP